MARDKHQKKRNLPLLFSKLAFLYLLVLAAFSWGYLSVQKKIFPYHLIQGMQNSIASAKAQTKLIQNPRSAHEIANTLEKGGVTVNNTPYGQDELVFATWYRDGQFIADLIDREGNVVHKWTLPHGNLDVSMTKDRAVILFAKNQTIHGAHLSSNGDVLLVIEQQGMLKLNKNSEVLWRTKEANHHAVAVGLDDTIWSLNRRQLKNSTDWVAMATAPYFDDTVVHYSADGELLEEFSVTKLIEDNHYEGILYAGPPSSPRLADMDPLHLNDIDVLTAEQAAHFPTTSAGDLMLSLRTVDTIIIVDPTTRSIKWSMTGPFLRQHDPQVTAGGLLLVYDNRTTQAQLGGNARYLRGQQKLGYSRLIAIDPVTRDIQWQYQGTPEHPFYSSIQGKVEEMPNGNVLAVEPEGGRIFEVDRASGNILWEYINSLEPGYVGRVTQAVPFRRQDLAFLNEETR
jgi:hypothetical protein